MTMRRASSSVRTDECMGGASRSLQERLYNAVLRRPESKRRAHTHTLDLSFPGLHAWAKHGPGECSGHVYTRTLLQRTDLCSKGLTQWARQTCSHTDHTPMVDDKLVFS